MEAKYKVLKEHGADYIGSGLLPVLSTPMLIGFMENVAQQEAQMRIAPGQTTVGIEIHMKHLKATAIGQEVHIVADFREQKKQILYYHIEAYEGESLVGQADHVRAIVDAETFMANVRSQDA